MSFWGYMARLFRSIVSDQSLMGVLLAATVLYSFFYPEAYSSQVAKDLPVAIVDLDHSAQSRAIIRASMSVEGVKVAQLPHSMDEARRALNRHEVDGILLIPDGFERQALGGRTGTLALFSNGAFLARNAKVLESLADVVMDRAAVIIEQDLRKSGVAGQLVAGVAMPVELVSRPLFNTRDGYGSYAVAGVAQLIVQQTLLFGIIIVMGRRNEQARARGLAKAERMSSTEFWATFTLFELIGLANAYYFNGFAFWLHDYPRGGNIVGMLLFTPLFIGAVTCFGMFCGSYFDKDYRAMQMLGVTSMPMFFLVGLSWPTVNIPPVLHQISRLLPSTDGINGYIKLNQMGASLSEISTEISTMLVLIVVFGGLAWWRLTHRQPGVSQ